MSDFFKPCLKLSTRSRLVSRCYDFRAIGCVFFSLSPLCFRRRYCRRSIKRCQEPRCRLLRAASVSRNVMETRYRIEYADAAIIISAEIRRKRARVRVCNSHARTSNTRVLAGFANVQVYDCYSPRVRRGETCSWSIVNDERARCYTIKVLWRLRKLLLVWNRAIVPATVGKP